MAARLRHRRGSPRSMAKGSPVRLSVVSDESFRFSPVFADWYLVYQFPLDQEVITTAWGEVRSNSNFKCRHPGEIVCLTSSLNWPNALAFQFYSRSESPPKRWHKDRPLRIHPMAQPYRSLPITNIDPARSVKMLRKCRRRTVRTKNRSGT